MRMGCVAAAVLAGLATLAAAPAAGVEDLIWLSGSWASREGDRWTEEWWTPPRGGIMIGAGFSGRGETATSFEHMRIMAGQDRDVAFQGIPGGAPAGRFSVVNGWRRAAGVASPASKNTHRN